MARPSPSEPSAGCQHQNPKQLVRWYRSTHFLVIHRHFRTLDEKECFGNVKSGALAIEETTFVCQVAYLPQAVQVPNKKRISMGIPVTSHPPFTGRLV